MSDKLIGRLEAEIGALNSRLRDIADELLEIDPLSSKAPELMTEKLARQERRRLFQDCKQRIEELEADNKKLDTKLYYANETIEWKRLSIKKLVECLYCHHAHAKHTVPEYAGCQLEKNTDKLLAKHTGGKG